MPWLSRDRLRAQGYPAEIFVRYVDPGLLTTARFPREIIPAAASLLYHHSIGSKSPAPSPSRPKCLIYHNITPAEFFEPYRPSLPNCCAGPAGCTNWPAVFRCRLASPPLTPANWWNFGFRDPGVLPLAIDPANGISRRRGDHAALQDGRTNLLFVAASVPTSARINWPKFLIYLRFDPTAR